MKIVVLDGDTLSLKDVSWDPIAKLGELTVYERSAPDEVLPRAKGCECLFTNKTVLSADVIAQLPELRYIGVLATGYDVVDVAAAKARNIPVCNVPTYGTTSVAQLAIALILEHYLAVGAHSRHVAEGGWARYPDYSYQLQPLRELSGRTIGFIGFGRIGQRTADIAGALGMNIVASDPVHSDQSARKNFRWVELDELYAVSDVISLHCNLTPENKGMINKDSIAKMKPNALIVNTARGGLIKELDLLDALKSKRVAGAALDVISQEPPVNGNILIGAPNAIVTPHIAWSSVEARSRLMDIAAASLESFLNGKTVNCVYR
ncbi:MAG: D-2-hydroxyacid dehydrogenase [Synergistaceae bacterium]|jgi:glycerate dehydrogenase|nr:D-2-hydroxyacid dehydrogenase [Synergistaceae bacterium]